jgi:hypothetical protein
MSAAKDKVIGSTIRNTAEMLRMEIGKQPISLADVAPVVRVALVVPEDPVVPAALVVLESPAARVALVVPEDPVVRVALVVPEDPVAPENPAVPVALELQTVPAAELERGIDPAARELRIVPVAEELVLAPAAELATDQPHGLLEVLAETKSVTVARHRGLAHLAVEDLAAVAETTPEPAATEVAVAWAAAG